MLIEIIILLLLCLIQSSIGCTSGQYYYDVGYRCCKDSWAGTCWKYGTCYRGLCGTCTAGDIL